MERRRFLIQSAWLLAGSLAGPNFFSKAVAEEIPRQEFNRKPRIAIIIDDIGQSPRMAQLFLKPEIPITFAVLPLLSYSYRLAVELHRQGHEIMLHQPMEPYNSKFDPGPGALYVGDDEERILKTLEENIAEVPYAVGVNNHMGSRFTSCRREILTTLEVVKEKKLFFVDSLTSSRSRAYRTAVELNLPAACRNIFLDNIVNESVVLSQLFKLQRCARIYGHAIGIGHPHAETARAIDLFANRLKDDDISFAYVSDVLC